MDFKLLQPGDKVRIGNNFYHNEDALVAVSVTAGSLGEIISFEEYCYSLRKLHRWQQPESFFAAHFSRVKLEIGRGEAVPVRVYEYAPLSNDLIEYWEKQDHQVHFWPANRVHLLRVQALEKIS